MCSRSFDPDIAARVALNAAVIFQNITNWIEKNHANRGNFRDGRYLKMRFQAREAGKVKEFQGLADWVTD